MLGSLRSIGQADVRVDVVVLSPNAIVQASRLDTRQDFYFKLLLLLLQKYNMRSTLLINFSVHNTLTVIWL